MRFIVACICLLIVGSSHALAQDDAPDIAATPEAFDYDSVSVGNIREHGFAVTNEGTAQLVVFSTEIQGADADQFQIRSGGGAFLLNPGPVRLVSVRFVPTRVGPQSAVLRLETNDPDENPFEINLSGIGLGFPDIATVGPRILAFNTVSLGSTDTLAIVVVNQGLVDLAISKKELTGPDVDQFEITDGAMPVSLAPQERDTITVSFTPSSNGEKNALLRLTSNDPDENPLDIVLSGSGISADIVADSTSHDFGEVAVGASAVHTFLISNQGSADLLVDSLVFLGADAEAFQVTRGGAPFSRRPGQTQQLTVQYTPTTEGVQQAVLRLFSNDPDEPELDFTLRATGLTPSIVASVASLDFGESLVTLDSTRTFILINTGRVDLRMLGVLVTGGDSTQFVAESPRLPFSLAPSDSSILTVRFRPTSTGAKRTTLRLISNDPDRSPLDIPLSGAGRTMEVEGARAISLGEDVDLTVVLPPGFRPAVKELYYRSAGEQDYRVAELTGTGPAFQGTIPGPVVTLGGVEYYILISDGANVATLPVSDPAGQPLFLPTRIDQLEAPVSLQAWTYQMITVPLELDDPAIAAVLADDYGPYNTRRWRLFHWDDDDYIEYPTYQAALTAGKSVWLITNDGAPFDVENGQSTNPSDPFTLTLQPGWNQVASPYTFPIAWPEERIDPRVEAPVSYDGAEFQYDETILRPWEGYFVRNLASSPLTVSLLPRASAARARKGTAAKRIQPKGTQYLLRLSAGVEGLPFVDTQNYIGLVEEASEGHDPFDFTEAPPIGDYVRLSIVEHGERYAGNFKPTKADGQHWDLEIDGTLSAGAVRVALAGTGQLPEGYGLYVMDRDHRSAIAVADSSFGVDMSAAFPVRRLRLLLGTMQYADDHGEGIPLAPLAFGLSPNYPNPFNPSTTIRYQLGGQSAVRLEIVNLLGRRVRTLVDATQEAGSYSARWDGLNDAGRAVASGVYLYRLRADGFVATRKMLLIR